MALFILALVVVVMSRSIGWRFKVNKPTCVG
jgi:hypothetical protein